MWPIRGANSGGGLVILDRAGGRETQGVTREERETNMWRVHLGGGSSWHRDHFVSQKQLATTVQ